MENSKSYYCGNYKSGCKISLWKETKYFDQKIKISKVSAKKLFAGDKIIVKLKNKQGKDYKIYFTGQLNGDYFNLLKGDFVNKKKK